MSADSSAQPATAVAVAPVPERAAAAILGSMILLILLLVAILFMRPLGLFGRR